MSEEWSEEWTAAHKKRKDRREKLFFQLSFFLPIVVPLLVYLIPADGLFRSGFGLIYWVVVSSILIGGIPYCIFLIGCFIWMRGKGAAEVRRMTWVAPPICMIILIGCALLLGLIQILSTANTVGIGGAIALLSFFTLILGYAYVLIVNFAFLFFRDLMRRWDPLEQDVAPTDWY